MSTNAGNTTRTRSRQSAARAGSRSPRALPALMELVDHHRDTQFVVVSHKATIRLLLCSLLAFDPRRYRDRLDMSPAALNVLDFQDLDHARLTLFNDVSHYMPTPEVPKGRLSRVWDVKG